MANLIRTSEGRLSFPHLSDLNQNGKYSIQILLSKSSPETAAFLQKLKAEAMRACIDLAGESKAQEVFKTQKFLKDGDNPDAFKTYYDTYQGSFVLSASRKESFGAPQCLNLYKKPIDPAELYAGCNVIVTVKPYSYNFNGLKGIALGFEHVMKTGDNEKFSGGGSNVDELFADVAIDAKDIANDAFGPEPAGYIPTPVNIPVTPPAPAAPFSLDGSPSTPAQVTDPFSGM